MKNFSRSILIFPAIVALAGCASSVSYDPTESIRSASSASINPLRNSVTEFLTTGTEEQAIERAKEVVANSLKDPSSAQFRKVRIVPYDSGKVICGEVNGKNSYGAYIGFTPFVSGIKDSAIYVTENSYPGLERALNAGWRYACESSQ